MLLKPTHFHIKMTGKYSQKDYVEAFWQLSMKLSNFCSVFSLLTRGTWQVAKSQNCSNQQKYSSSSQSPHLLKSIFFCLWNKLSVKKLHKINGIIFFVRHHFLFHIETLITLKQLILPRGGELVSILDLVHELCAVWTRQENCYTTWCSINLYYTNFV